MTDAAHPPHPASTLTIETRYRGPARSGNGGYTAGLLAERLLGERLRVDDRPTTVEVTLRRPPPLEEPVCAQRLDAGAPGNDTGAPHMVLHTGDEPIAEARVVDRELTPVEAVDATAAGAAMAHYAGLRSHPFPGCFSCGPDRAEGDGLRIFPGPVASDVVASTWVPDGSLAVASDLIDAGVARVGVATTWAALDCVGGWSEDLEGRPMVLGRITARVDALPVVGELHVVVGRRLGSEGRKSFTASTLYDSDGRVVASAEHVWIAVDPDVFN